MSAPIESRLQMDITYDIGTRRYVATAYDSVTGDVYVQIKQWSDHWIRQNLYDAVSQFLKEWKCQDQTSSTELQYRKTIISECGRLRVKESPSLMETCYPTS